MGSNGTLRGRQGPRLASFFAGIGGFELGFSEVGARAIFQCEIDSACQRILAKNFPRVPQAQDVRDIDPDSLPEADIWTAGFPCQDLSLAKGPKGRAGLRGDKSGLFFDFVRLVEARKPPIVIVENVAGLLNSHKGRDFGTILESLTSLGYGVAWRQLNSYYFGSPQSRLRVYLVAWKGRPDLAARVLFESNPAAKVGILNGFRTPTKVKGTDIVVPRTAYCLSATAGRHTGMDWSKTYVTGPDYVRRLTPLEYERIQGFPDQWTLPMQAATNDAPRYRAVGNAVTVNVIKWLARNVAATMRSAQAHDSMPRRWIAKFPSLEQADAVRLQASNSHRWKNGGTCWKGIARQASCSVVPSNPVEGNLASCIDSKAKVEDYAISANAAKGILRRVEKQGRTLFAPVASGLRTLALQESRDLINPDRQLVRVVSVPA